MATIQEAKNSIKKGIQSYLLKKEDGSYLLDRLSKLPFYLEGPPGVGKTQIVSQLAEEMGIGYVSFSLTHHTRNTLLGLPVISDLPDGEKFTRYTMSEILAAVYEQVQAGKEEGILLLDEFPCMAESIFPIMLAFLQTGNIGQFTLPEGWVLVLCGNPSKYNRASRNFDSALLDRIRKIEIEFSAKAFLDYAKEQNFHEAIQNFLQIDQQLIYRCELQDGKENLVTCRGWENLSETLKAYERANLVVDQQTISQFIKAPEICDKFWTYYKRYALCLSPERVQQILEGKKVPKVEQQLQKMGIEGVQEIGEFFIETIQDIYAKESELVEQYSAGDEDEKKMEVMRKMLAAKVKICSRQLENLFQWFGHLDVSRGVILQSQLFSAINENPFLVYAMSTTPAPSYKTMAQDIYQVS